MTIYEPAKVSKFEYRGGWIPYRDVGDKTWPIAWVDRAGKPLGIPVAHFKNPDLRPEALDAIPIQDAINKTLLDVLGAGDSTAFRIFTAFGFIPTTDGKAPEADGSNWMRIEPAAIIGTSAKGPQEASFDAIDGADLGPLLEALQQLLLYSAIVTRTPVTRFQVTGQVAAEGTLKQQNESLISKIKLRQTLFGNAWEDTLAIARRIQNAFGTEAALNEEEPFSAQWAEAETRNDLQVAQELQIKHDSLGVPLHQIWSEFGYSEADIERMLKYREEELTMQQRVALARAIVNQPKILLLDEPMAALDKKLRRDMQIELQTLQRQLGITFVLVTHDQEEALSMSDRICVMQAGKIVQIGSPRELYDAPKTKYVADFVGKSNFFEGKVAQADPASITVAGRSLSGTAPRALAAGQPGFLCLRPEQISLRHAAEADRISLPVTIAARIFLGEHTEYLVRNADLGEFLVLVPRQAEAQEGAFEPGQTAHATWRDGVGLILGKD